MTKITLEDVIAAAQSLEKHYGGGPPLKEYCQSGKHLMADHGRQRYKKQPSGVIVKSGRYCKKCKQDRERRYAQAKREAKAQ